MLSGNIIIECSRVRNPMTKKEALAIFKRMAGYTFVGYKDTGYGFKAYCFTPS